MRRCGRDARTTAGRKARDVIGRCQLPDNLTVLLPPVLAIIRRHLVFFWRYVWLYLSTLKG